MDIVVKCRLCGSTTVKMLDVFSSMGRKLDLSNKIATNIGIHMNVKDDAPKTICLNCVGNLEYFIKFIKRCHEMEKCYSDLLKKRSLASSTDGQKQVKRGEQSLNKSLEPSQSSGAINNEPLLNESFCSVNEQSFLIKSSTVGTCEPSLDQNAILITDVSSLSQTYDISVDDVVQISTSDPNNRPVNIIINRNDTSTVNINDQTVISGGKNFECQDCGFVYYSVPEYREHIILEQSLKYSLPSDYKTWKHLEKHSVSGGSNALCSLCSATVISFDDYVHHLKQFHCSRV